MKIAVITSGLLPVPAVKGGAIETLLDSFVKVNEIEKKTYVDIYSISDTKIKKNKLKYSYSKFYYISLLYVLVIKVLNKLFKKSIPVNYLYQKRVVNVVNKKKYDYIIVENYPELALKLKGKVIPYIHSDVFNVECENCKNILDKSYKVITVSNFIKDRVDEIYNSDKVKTVYNSIDLKKEDIKKEISFRKRFRKLYGINDNDIVFAYSGRISKEKGVLELVKAFNNIKIDNKKLLIIGGTWYSSKKKNAYLEQIKNISSDNVIFTGYIDHSSIQHLLYACDVGVVPSTCNEAAGLSVVEFMFTNNIVIATNKGGIPEYLNKACNILVDYNDNFIINLSEAMKKSIDLINKNNLKNNKEYCEKFNVMNNYNNIINVLKEGESDD